MWEITFQEGRTQMKDFFFGIPALALLLVGCDDGNSGPAATDAGRLDSQPAQFTVQGKTVLGTLACSIPASTRAQPKAGTVPSVGYRLFNVESSQWDSLHCVEQFGYFPGEPPTPNKSTDCGSPENGFALSDSDPWCCVNAASLAPGAGMGVEAYPSSYMTTPMLECTGYAGDLSAIQSPQDIAGKVALCSVDGRFMGWDCDTKMGGSMI